MVRTDPGELLTENAAILQYVADPFPSHPARCCPGARAHAADAYLVTVLHWTLAVPIDLEDWPPLAACVARLRERPRVARAFQEELPLYMAEPGAAQDGVTSACLRWRGSG